MVGCGCCNECVEVSEGLFWSSLRYCCCDVSRTCISHALSECRRAALTFLTFLHFKRQVRCLTFLPLCISRWQV